MPEVPLGALVLYVPPFVAAVTAATFPRASYIFPAPKVRPNRKAEALDSSLL